MFCRGAPIFLGWCFEHQFSSSSRTLSKEIDKWVLLMWGVRKLWWAIITNNTIKLKFCIPMWPAAWLQQHDSSIFVYTHIVTRLNLSTLIYILLVTRLFSSTFVCIYLWLVYIRLLSSSDSSTLVCTRLHLFTFVCDPSTFVYTHLVTRLYFQNRSFKSSICFTIGLFYFLFFLAVFLSM